MRSSTLRYGSYVNIWDEGSRIARPLTFLVAAAIVLGACSAEPDASDDAALTEAEGAEGIAPGAPLEDAELPVASPMPWPTPMPVALDIRPIDIGARPELAGADLRPGFWSPDGKALIVWRVVDQTVGRSTDRLVGNGGGRAGLTDRLVERGCERHRPG